ncbi:hypothetical protein HELRODRAFT_173478 [Helobdella robusta]|uniref:EF-hand domain-containing protein n=1 Tax=Helobdella robusta TaxID=6412 RepID=T1F6V3_HELRO|nr:hypothetical protein HELRODRAFT_173478 [Helobdella robusta]ESO03775.1 hypothetical protein HELRODRAFT_173478 [Helobdella robusta]
MAYETDTWDSITLDAGAQLLMKELNYPKERAYQVVKKFDHNKDGKLSGKEIINFKNNIQETWVLRSSLNFASDGEVVREVGREFQRKGPEKAKADLAKNKRTILPKFKEYDKDNNGYVTLNEASKVLSQKPFNFPSSKILTLLHKFDKDGNGKLDIEEFADFYADAKAFNEEISDHFSRLDVDRNGLLNVQEVKNVCTIFFNPT